MKYLIVLFYLFPFVFCGDLIAQTDEKQNFLLTSATNSLQYQSLEIIDPYLSPLVYGGSGFGYDYQSQRYLGVRSLHFSRMQQLKMSWGNIYNPSHTAAMTVVGANYGWGIHYHFKTIGKLHLQFGGLADLDFGLKYLARNVNNPVNVDMATNINLSGLVFYDFSLFKRKLKLIMDVKSPLLGCMFVPYSGASYYEMFSLGNTSNTIHFSSLHNKRGLDVDLRLEVPLRKSVWQVGVGLETMKWKANDLVFNRHIVRIILAKKFDFITFGGNRNKAPINFISPTE